MPTKGMWKPVVGTSPPPPGRIPRAGASPDVSLPCAKLVPDVVLHDLAVDQLDFHGLGAAVAAEQKRDLAAGGNLPQHAAKLLCAFHFLPVDFEHHVVDSQADLARRGIVVDQRDDRAADFLELEPGSGITVDVGNQHSQVARGGVRQQGIDLLQDLRDFCGLRRRSGRRQEKPGAERAARQERMRSIGTASKGTSLFHLRYFPRYGLALF